MDASPVHSRRCGFKRGLGEDYSDPHIKTLLIITEATIT